MGNIGHDWDRMVVSHCALLVYCFNCLFFFINIHKLNFEVPNSILVISKTFFGKYQIIKMMFLKKISALISCMELSHEQE